MTMDIDALIEQVAFGKTTTKLSSCLGMYLSPEVIYLSEVHFENGRPVVDHLVRVPVPASAPKPGQTASGATTLTTDFLNDSAKIQALIRQAMAQMRWNSKNVVVSLSHHLGLVRYFSMPGVERRFWASAVPVEAKKYIPIPFDALNHDFQVVGLPPSAEGKPRQGALIAVTPKKNLPSIKGLLEGLGLTLVGLEIAPCSVLRMWNALDGGKPKDPYCQVHFDGGSVRIVVSDKGIPVFFREVFLGAEASAQDSRKVDVGGCLNFAQKQLNVAKLNAMRISGATSDAEQWLEIATKESGTQAVLHDTPAMLGIKGGDWGGYASIGAALRFLAPTTMTLDLSDTGRISDVEKKTAKYILLLAGAFSLLLIALGLVGEMVCSIRARELRKYKREPDIEEVFMGKKPEEIEKLLAGMREQYKNLKVMEDGARLKKVELIREIIAAMPERTWITAMTFRESPTGDIDLSREMTVAGHASAASIVEEQDLSFEFRDRLKKSPLISKLFADLQVSVEAARLGDEQQANQEQYKRRLEERTTFRIIAKARKK